VSRNFGIIMFPVGLLQVVLGMGVPVSSNGIQSGNSKFGGLYIRVPKFDALGIRVDSLLQGALPLPQNRAHPREDLCPNLEREVEFPAPQFQSEDVGRLDAHGRHIQGTQELRWCERPDHPRNPREHRGGNDGIPSLPPAQQTLGGVRDPRLRFPSRTRQTLHRRIQDLLQSCRHPNEGPGWADVKLLMARDLDMEDSVRYTADLRVADQKRVQDPPRWKTKICVSSIPDYNL
jgi:hypothetical protein